MFEPDSTTHPVYLAKRLSLAAHDNGTVQSLLNDAHEKGYYLVKFDYAPDGVRFLMRLKNDALPVPEVPPPAVAGTTSDRHRALLANGPVSLPEIHQHLSDVSPNTIKSALRRNFQRVGKKMWGLRP